MGRLKPGRARKNALSRDGRGKNALSRDGRGRNALSRGLARKKRLKPGPGAEETP